MYKPNNKASALDELKKKYSVKTEKKEETKPTTKKNAGEQSFYSASSTKASALDELKAKYSKPAETEKKQKETESKNFYINNRNKGKDREIPTFEERQAAANERRENARSLAGQSLVVETPHTKKTDAVYDSVKNKKDGTTTIPSTLSEEERKTRISEIDSRLSELTKVRSGLDRAAMYGNVGDRIKEVEEEQARLSAERKELERTGTFTGSEALEWEISDAKAEVQRLNAEIGKYGSRPSVDKASELQKLYSELYNAQSTLDNLKRQKTLYKDIDKYGEDVKEDTFGGQWSANYRLADLEREASKAMSRYLDNPTEENLEIAYAYDAFVRKYQTNNATALDDEKAVLPWLSKSAAGYMPQFLDQTVPQVIGGGIGALLGSQAGLTAQGAALGAGIATGGQSYVVMRGSVYRALIAEGIDEEIAREAANDEALISSLIEGGGTALSFLTLGGGKALSAIGSAATKSVANGSKNAAVKFLANMTTQQAAKKAASAAAAPIWKKGLSVAGGVALDAGGEYLEEFTQQGVGIANKERAKSGNMDENLLAGTGKVVADALTGKNAEVLKEMHEAGVEGAKIGLMFGGSTAIANNVISSYANAKTVTKQNEIVDFIISDEESLDALIEEGKASGKGTYSEKIATEVEAAKENGNVTRGQVKRLIASNEVYIKSENEVEVDTVEEAPATLEEAAMAVVEERNNTQERTENAQERTEGVSDVGNTIPTPEVRTAENGGKKASGMSLVEMLDFDTSNNRDVPVEMVKMASGFGDAGSVLVTKLASEDGVTYSQAKKAVETAYNAGFTGLDGSNVKFATDTQRLAFEAGKDDRRVADNKNVAIADSASIYDGSVDENENFKKLSPEAQEMHRKIAKDAGLRMEFVDKLVAAVVDDVEYEANAQHEDGVYTRSSASADEAHVDVIHEVFHRMKQVAPEETGELLNAIYQFKEHSYKQLSLGVSLPSELDSINEEYLDAKLPTDTFTNLEEMGARFVPTLFKNEADWNNWRATIDKSPSLKRAWNRFIRFLNEIIDKAKNYLSQIGMTAQEKANARNAIAELENIKKLYTKAYVAMMDNVEGKADSKNSQNDGGNKTAEGYNGSVSHSLKNWRTGLTHAQVTKIEEWVDRAGKNEAKQITDTAFWYNGRLNGNDLFVIYSTEDDKATVLYLSKGRKANTEQAILLNILEEYENGKSVNGKPTYVNWVSGGGWMQQANSVQNNQTNLGTGANNQNVRVLPGQSKRNGSGAFWNVIEDLFGKYETGVKYSLKDSNGNALTEEQQKRFADSKVRDEEGNLKVMYRGDANEFTVFDRKKSRASNLYGRGFYFTDSKSHAEQYGKATAYYLDIKNPLSPGQNSITKEQMLKFLEAIENDGEDYDLYNYGEGATAQSVLDEVWGKDDFAMLQDINASAVGNLVAAVELFNEVNGTSYDGIMLPTETVTFNSEQAKLTSNKKPTNNPDVRFSLKKPVEKTKELVAVHNMQVAELEKSLDLGGLPMPSIAIIKAESGHSEYGDVSLVFPKSTIDPEVSKDNKVYGGDAWTPVYPKIEFKANAKVQKNINDTYYRLAKQFGYDEARPLYNYAQDLEDELNRTKGEAELVEGLKKDTRLMQLFLLDSGKSKVDDVMKETKTTLSKEETAMYDYLASAIGKDVVSEISAPDNVSPMTHRKEYWNKHGEEIKKAYGKMLSDMYDFSEEQIENVEIGMKTFDYLKLVASVNKYLTNGAETVKSEKDYAATEQAIKDAVDTKAYQEWINSLFKGAEEKSGIRNNTDYFTPSGNRRSWEALHWENNLENVVKVMKSGSNGDAALFAGQGIWGVSAKDYKSVEELKADKDRLQRLSEEEYSEIKRGFGARFEEIADSIMNKSERNQFIAMDNAMECIVDAVRVSKTRSGILKTLKQYQHLNVTETTVNDIVSLVSDISNMPTEYFEAKPKRAVGFDEVATAIIPNDTSAELKAKLEENNVPYIEYEKGNEQSRLDALNSLEDVKFSLKKKSDTSSQDTKKLLDTIEALKHEFEVTKLAKADPKKLAKVTREILKEYGSGADFENAFKDIDELYTYMANGEDGHPAAWEDVYDKATNVASRIIEYAVAYDDSTYQEYEGLRNYLRKTPIKFNSKYHDVPMGYENFLEFRRRNFGKLNIKKDGMAVDKVYQELAEMYPEYFDAHREITVTAMLERMVEVLDEIKPTTYNPFESQMREVTAYLANDIIDRFFDIPQAKPTFADKAERRVTEAKIAGRKKLEQAREQRDAEIDKTKLAERMYYGRQMNEMRNKLKANLAEQRMKAQEHIEELRAKKNVQIEKEKAKRRDALAKMSESQKAKVLRARIMRHASELSQKLLRPSDNKHIPQDLQGAVAVLLENINLESNIEYVYGTDAKYHRVKAGTERAAEPTKRTAAFVALKELYEKKEANVTIDPDLIGAGGLLSDVIALGDKPIADMNSAELTTVWQTMRAVEATISRVNKMFSMGKYAEISEIAEALRDANGGKNVKKELRIGGKMQNLASLEMLTPETYFHYLGDAGDEVFRMMSDAQGKYISIMREVADFTHEDLKDVNVNKLEKTVHTVTLGGENVKLTTAQLMELYVLMKREQAVEHILIGGILPDEIDKGVFKNSRAEPLRNITQEEIGEALTKLTAEEKSAADKMQKFVSTVLSKHGNEASMKVYNYEKFLEENYWTIRTNKQEIASEIGKDTAVTSVANKGMAKGTVPHANTSVRLGSIFNTFSAHSADMATYAAWLGTTEDINRIRNFVFWEDGARAGTVKGILDTVHGTQGSAYLEKLLTDISIGVKGSDNKNPLDKLIGNYKAASVGANIRVIIQQPTAILRALDMIAPQYITAGAVRPLNGWKKAKKYAPIAQWKDWGHFDINTGRQMKDVLFDNASLLEKTKQAGMWGASMADSVSWGLLWNAVEAETKAKHKELKVGSDEYYKAVAKRFTEVIDHTQVVDGILQRSGIMREGGALTKMATSFMGEPTKQYNMVMAAVYDAKTKKNKSAFGRLGRTAISLGVAGVVNACMQSFIDALRDDDKEKDYWEKWLEAFMGSEDDTWFQKGGNLGDTFNPLTYIPFAKDVLSIFQGYDVKRMDMDAISKLATSAKNMYKTITGEGKYTMAEASASFFADIARLYGVPVANIKRDIKSIATTIAIESDNYLMQYRMEKGMLDINYSGNRGNFIDILYNASVNDREAYEFIYDDLKKSGYTDEQIKSGMETRMKKAEGVEKTSDLSKRYMNPENEKTYDSKLKKVQASKVWKSANEEQRNEAEANLYNFITSTSKDMEQTRTEARAFGVDETEYTLWNLAKEMADDGNGSLNAKEKAAAVEMLNLDDAEITYFYDTKQADEAYSYGIDMTNYAMFKAAISGLKGDDKQDKVVAYAEQFADNEKEYLYFVATEYSSWKKRNDYIKYFSN